MDKLASLLRKFKINYFNELTYTEREIISLAHEIVERIDPKQIMEKK